MFGTMDERDLRPLPGVTQHAREQLRDRHGLLPRLQDWLKAVSSILEGRAVLVRRKPDGTEVWLVLLCGLPVRLVWVPETGCVVTALPRYERNDQWGPRRPPEPTADARHRLRRLRTK